MIGRHKDRGPAFVRNRSPINWLLRHAQVMLASLGRLSRSPLGTTMTAAVLGIAIALPAGLHTLVNHVQHLSDTWDGSVSISLFLHADIKTPEAERLAQQLRAMPGVAELRLITPEQALQEFRKLSGFGEATDILEQNPLPAVLLVTPTPAYSEPDKAEQLLLDLRARPEVELAQLDLQWVRRLHAITLAIERAVWVLAALLSLAVLLIVGNTIRLEIQNRRPEIEITKLVGATNAFIRRPFLYDGLWYGLLGGLIAWLLVSLSLWMLQGPVAQLSGLYDSLYRLDGPGLGGLLLMLAGGGLLGLAGAWIAVGRHLSDIEPT